MIKSINPTNPSADKSFLITTQSGVMTDQVGIITGDIELSQSSDGTIRANYDESSDLYTVDIQHYKDKGVDLSDLEKFGIHLENAPLDGVKPRSKR